MEAKMEDGMVHVIPQGDLVYAEKPPVVSNYTPKSVDEYIDALEFGQNGQLFLATSSLNKRSWTGDLWWFPTAEDAPHAEKACTGYRMDSGIARIKYIGSNQLVMGLDSGALQLVRVNSTPHETRDTLKHFFEMHPSYCEHDDRISDLDTWASKDQKEDESHVLSGGMDGRVIVWDKNMGIRHSFHPAHSAGVISVSCNQENTAVFATAGLEGTIKVWNTKNEKPCRTIYSDPSEPPAVISWIPGHPTKLLVASKTGKVLILDTESKSTSSQISVMDREIRTLRWSVDRPSLCAVAGDDTTVSVISLDQASDITIKYTKQSHKDFVRGLAWQPGTGILWSSGWDRQVISHQIE